MALTRQAGQRPVRLSVGVIGAGRVGCVLGKALADAGHRVVAVSGMSPESVSRAGEYLPGVPMYAPEDVLDRVELVLLTVPDDALAPLVSSFTEHGVWHAGQIVVHTSATAGVEVLAPARPAYILPVSLYPAMRFSGTRLDLDRLRSGAVVVSTLPELRPIGEALVIEMGAEPVWVAPQDRPMLRAALSHVGGVLEVALGDADELLSRAGIDSRARVLTALTSSVVDDVLHGRSSPGEPAAAGVLRADLAALNDLGAASRSLHVALVRAQLAGAVFQGRLPAGRIDELLDVLGDMSADGDPQ